MPSSTGAAIAPVTIRDGAITTDAIDDRMPHEKSAAS